MDASEEGNPYPSPNDIIEITWLTTHTIEQVKVESINNASIKIEYLDNHETEELQFDNGNLPFEWKLIKHNSSEIQHSDPPIIQSKPNESHNNNNNNTAESYDMSKVPFFTSYNNKGNRWQPKSKTMPNNQSNNNNKPLYNEQKTNNNNKKPFKMKRKEIPKQRNIVRTLSAVTTSTNKASVYIEHNHQQIDEYNNNIDKSRLPLKGDIVSISYSGGSQNDPVRIIHSGYYGDARVRYTDAQGAENDINFLRNTDITYTITNSVYQNNDIQFIPAPRKGDLIEIRWIEDGGRDVVIILDCKVEYTDEYIASQNNKKNKKNECKHDENSDTNNINHFNKFNSIWITFEYIDDKEQEKLDFHPNAISSEILSWRILQCSRNAGLDNDNDIKYESHELNAEICSLCCTPFGEFPYRTVVPCVHNNVCGKCTLRMRYFGNFNNDKHPYPMCPFCKESWELVAFIPLEWTISIINQYNKDKHKNKDVSLSKYEWDIVFSSPLEYDDDIGCYFTDIHTLQQFRHIRSLYCLFCNPSNKIIEHYNKVYYFHSVGKLLYHLRHEHTSFMCELCLNNATLFMDEQRLFINDKRLLIDHQRYGSKIKEQYGETLPHPFCTLCRANFYSREILYEHCENTHCSCHLCKQSGILEYYKQPSILKEHQRNLHHLCEHKECLAKLQPVVFDDPVLLQSHQLQVHGWHKPMHSIIPGFIYSEDKYTQPNTNTMNFSTIFTQNVVNELNVNTLNNNNSNNDNNNIIPEEQRLRQRQKQNHKRMDDIKKRWFPNSYKLQQKQRYNKRIALQLGLRHIPDAIAIHLKEEKNKLVIKQIRQVLISQFNFKQFQIISNLYSTNKIKSNIFFHRFKNLFEPLCEEKIWIDILMQMLALLRDGGKRRHLYEQYRDWIIGGRVSKNTKIKQIKQNKGNYNYNNVSQRINGNNNYNKNVRIQKQNKNIPLSAAAIVAGTYKRPTKAMIMSQRRAQKVKNRRGNKNNNVSKVMTTFMGGSAQAQGHTKGSGRGQWGKGAPKMANKSRNNRDKNVVVVDTNVEVKQHWPSLGHAKPAAKAPKKWVDETVNNNTKIVNKNKLNDNKNKNKVNDNKNEGNVIGNNSNKKKKKTKRGPRKKKKKNKQNVEVNNGNNVSNVNNKPKVKAKVKAKPKPVVKVMKMTEKGKMPHELKNKRFNKANPWGISKGNMNNTVNVNIVKSPKIQQPVVNHYDDYSGIIPTIIIKKVKKKHKKKKKSKQ